jgi:hypothetical protein
MELMAVNGPFPVIVKTKKDDDLFDRKQESWSDDW